MQLSHANTHTHTHTHASCPWFQQWKLSLCLFVYLCFPVFPSLPLTIFPSISLGQFVNPFSNTLPKVRGHPFQAWIKSLSLVNLNATAYRGILDYLIWLVGCFFSCPAITSKFLQPGLKGDVTVPMSICHIQSIFLTGKHFKLIPVVI